MTGLLSDLGKNTALDALGGFIWISLHYNFSPIGDYEFSGGLYARQAVSYAAADGGLKVGGSVTFPTPPIGYLSWIGAWDAATGGNFLGMAPNGSSRPYLFSGSDLATGVISSPGHTLVDDDTVFLFTGSFGSTVLPGGFSDALPYYVVGSAANTFQLSLTSGGAPIVPTAAGMGFVQRYLLQLLDGSTDLVVVAFTIDATLF